MQCGPWISDFGLAQLVLAAHQLPLAGVFSFFLPFSLVLIGPGLTEN